MNNLSDKTFLLVMQYVYVLRSKQDNTLYTGCTKDLVNRMKLHNKGQVSATKRKIPYELLYYEAYRNVGDAFNREQYLKTGWGRNYLKKVLNYTLQTKEV